MRQLLVILAVFALIVSPVQAQYRIERGETDVSINFVLVDPSTGDEETGLTITALDMSYAKAGSTLVKADATALTAITDAHADWKMFEVDATNAPGLYRADFPDAAFSGIYNFVDIIVKGAAINTAVIGCQLYDDVKADVTKISGDSTAADNLESYTDGTDRIGVDVQEIGSAGNTAAADTLKRMYDGTGYAGGAIELGVDVVGLGAYGAGGTTLGAWLESENSNYPQVTVEWIGLEEASVLADFLGAGIGTDNKALISTDAQDLSDSLSVNTKKFDSSLDMTSPMKASVNAEADTAISDYDPPTKTEFDNGLAGLNDPTAASVADAVWNEAISGHTTGTTFGGKNQKAVPSETIADYKATGFSTFDVASDSTITNQASRTASKADVSGLSTFDHTSNEVTTDSASRTASMADVSGLSTFDASGDSVITDQASRTASKADVSDLSTVKTTTDKLDDTLELDGAVYRYTTNALEQAPSGTGGDATAANQTAIIAQLTTAQADLDNPSQYQATGGGDTEVEYTLTITGTSTPIVDCAVEVRSTNDASADIITRGYTNDAGVVTFMLDSGVTYYAWRTKAGYTFSNPDTIEVP